ncbi:MAG: release factor glutamine methyltransferase [Candidatus Saganbacteria bacterium]|uniref:Release factor glutamine methyltransferase n=1 Tax=Candidatus Saganbacteria bacterium TaxID=2575572 RepID=A0A833NRF4_UNCSA|nr:MAG: release factor glutamine methyltransferase [Candidatus Saganbacteria bacterium]
MILMCHALKISHSHLAAHPELFDKNNPIYKKYLERRKNHEPIAYILGFQPFLGLNIQVNKNVLIPRPETEYMAELAIKYLPKNKNTIIADIGCGSGCLSIALAHYLTKSKLFAVDPSKKALNIAKLNANSHNLSKRIKFIKGDLFSKLHSKFDCIISNPPYIPTGEIDKLMPDVSHWEPKIALNGGKDGQKFIKRIIADSPKHLKPNGFLLVEFGYKQSKAVEKLANKYFNCVEIIKDLSGIKRYLLAREKL